jgi:hypothetical protein
LAGIFLGCLQFLLDATISGLGKIKSRRFVSFRSRKNGFKENDASKTTATCNYSKKNCTEKGDGAMRGG